MNKQEILTNALEQRNNEIFEYQINIDNYIKAIEKINVEHTGNDDMDQSMQEFKVRLQELLTSSMVEQRKAVIIRDVIQAQLNELAS